MLLLWRATTSDMSGPAIQMPVAIRPSPSTTVEKGENGQPFLALRQVSNSFGSNLVLDRVSFAVIRGETLCVMGRSGAGKSVRLQILMGFSSRFGRVIAAGEDITEYSEERLERIHTKVTMVFQNGALFNSHRVGDNVAYALRERRAPTKCKLTESLTPCWTRSESVRNAITFPLTCLPE